MNPNNDEQVFTTEAGNPLSAFAGYFNHSFDARDYLAMGVLAVSLVFVHFFYRRAKKGAAVRALWDEFEENGKRKGLLSPQRLILRELLACCPIPRPSQVCESRDVFDKVVSNGLKALRRGEQSSDSVDTVISELRTIRRKLGFDRLRAGEPLKSTRELQQKQAVHVLFSGRNVSEPGSVLHVDDGHFSLEMQYQKHFEEFLSRGTPVVCSFFIPNDARYRFETLLVKDTIESEPLQLEHCDAVSREQERQYFRLAVSLPVEYAPVRVHNLEAFHMQSDPAQTDAETPRQWGRTLDLSGGGLALLSETALLLGTMLRLRFELDGTPFDVLGEVMVAREIEPGRFKYGIEFAGIKEVDRDVIIQFVYRKERDSQDKLKPLADKAGAAPDNLP